MNPLHEYLLMFDLYVFGPQACTLEVLIKLKERRKLGEEVISGPLVVVPLWKIPPSGHLYL